MNRRKLKKAINDSMRVLYGECLYHELVNDANKEEVESIKGYINDKHNDLIARVSVREGKEVYGRVKQFYAKLWDDITKDIRDIDSRIAKLTK